MLRGAERSTFRDEVLLQLQCQLWLDRVRNFALAPDAWFAHKTD
jgi:hypothetical protein